MVRPLLVAYLAAVVMPFAAALIFQIPPATKANGTSQGKGSLNESVDQSPKLLVTTAYWKIPSKRGGPDQSDRVYHQCMFDVLSLRAPLVIYGDSAALAEMQHVRGAVEPPFVAQVPLEIKELMPCSRHPELFAHSRKYTNRWDVPSVDLGCIWDGKPDLLGKSAHDYPDYEWYAWLDVCMGHGEVPFKHGDQVWPNPDLLRKLPKDKVVVSLSQENFCESCRLDWSYCHCIAGTAFVVPRSLVQLFSKKFTQKVDECLQALSDQEAGGYICLSDQVIMTKMLLDSPDLFYIGSAGYGAVATQELTSP